MRAARLQVEAIRTLVRLGCAAAVQDNVASTPLHVAAGEGHLEAIHELVKLVRALMRALSLCTLLAYSVSAGCTSFARVNVNWWDDVLRYDRSPSPSSHGPLSGGAALLGDAFAGWPWKAGLAASANGSTDMLGGGEHKGEREHEGRE